MQCDSSSPPSILPPSRRVTMTAKGKGHPANPRKVLLDTAPASTHLALFLSTSSPSGGFRLRYSSPTQNHLKILQREPTLPLKTNQFPKISCVQIQ